MWRQYHEAAGHAGVKRALTTAFLLAWNEGDRKRLQLGCADRSLQRGRTEPRAILYPVLVSYPMEILAVDFCP